MGKIDYTATLGRTFYEEAAPDEIPKDGMALVLRGAPTARASADYYVNHVRDKFGDVSKHIINEHAWGGAKSGLADGSITIVTNNTNGLTSVPEIPMFLDGIIIGTHDISRGQISILKHKVCRDPQCRSIDGACVPACKATSLKGQMAGNKDVAIKKAFTEKLNANQDVVQSLRGVLKKKAVASGNGYCARFNKTGIPCYPCKFSPCEEWDELMETMLSNTLYKDMPDAVRRAAGRGRMPHARRGARGKGDKKPTAWPDDDDDDMADEE